MPKKFHELFEWPLNNNYKWILNGEFHFFTLEVCFSFVKKVDMRMLLQAISEIRHYRYCLVFLIMLSIMRIKLDEIYVIFALLSDQLARSFSISCLLNSAKQPYQWWSHQLNTHRFLKILKQFDWIFPSVLVFFLHIQVGLHTK